MFKLKQCPSSLSCMLPVPFPASKWGSPVPFPALRPVVERELSIISTGGGAADAR